MKASRLRVHIPPGGLSLSCEWETDLQAFETLDRLFGPFKLDACATRENAKCANFLTVEHDALSIDWGRAARGGAVWMNPPYGREIARWMQKAFDAGSRGQRVVCLVPARTDTEWWHECAMEGRIWFVRGRLRFGGARSFAPFPSAVVVFGPWGMR